MNIEAEKSELINWIGKLKNQQLIQEILLLKEKTEKPTVRSPRKFGDGKHIFTYIAEDFNAPLDDFKEYMK